MTLETIVGSAFDARLRPFVEGSIANTDSHRVSICLDQMTIFGVAI
jgi:hypothetical protein